MPRWYQIPVVRQCGHALIYFPMRAIGGAVGLLPPSIAGPASVGLGRLAHLVARKELALARANVALAFPEMPRKEREQLIRGMYRHFGRMVADLPELSRLRADTLHRYVEFPAVEEVRAIVAEGKGGIIITGHFGNWEVAGAALGLLGFDTNLVARPYRNPHIKRTMVRFRRQFGQKIVWTSEGLPAMEAVLRQGGLLAVAPDKRLKRSNMPATFFGREVTVPGGPAILSAKTGAPLLPGAAVRVGKNFQYRIIVGDPIWPDPDAKFLTEVRRLSAAYMLGLEKLIRDYPEQWIWFHDRFKDSRAASPVPQTSPLEPDPAKTAQ